ncbi:MAG: sulfurtransferase [Robiginitomaculum sp.]|nr:MAG: sulfurtransferase [Robiginitomaculum sp.]
MALDRMIFAFAGIMTLIGIYVGLKIHVYGFGLSVFVGVNMLQAAFTGFCPLAMMLKKLGVKPGKAFS